MRGKRKRQQTVTDVDFLELQSPVVRNRETISTYSTVRTRREANLSSQQRTKLLAEYSLLPTAVGGLKKVGVAKLEDKWCVSRGYIRRCLLPNAMADDRGTSPLKTQVNNRKPRVFTEEMDQFMTDQALKWEGEFSWQDMANAVNEKFELEEGVPSLDGVRKHCIQIGWTDTKQKVLPYLTPEQMTARREWARKNKRQKYRAWVDLDEKWFFTVRLHGKRKRPPGEKLPPRYLKSKSNIPKVMILVAVARPREGFDGTVGMWRIAEPAVTKRSSKNRPAGQAYEQDVSMTADKYFELMKDEVMPAIAKLFSTASWKVREVIVQQDGAKPHTGKKVVERLNKIGAEMTPKIALRTQPAQSPDFNVCDLALFRGLESKVRKLRRGLKEGLYDKEKLTRDVKAALTDYPSETLEKMWGHKEFVMERVASDEIAGGNNYNHHHDA